MDERYWSSDNTIGVGAGISSSPKIIDDKIMFGAHDKFFYALEPETGSIIWKFETRDAIVTTPASDKNSIYVGSQDGFLYSFDKEGNIKWKFYAGSRIVGPPVFGNERVVFGTDEGILFVLSPEGKLLWKFSAGGAVRTAPSMVNDKIIFGSHDHCLYCLNEYGLKEWKFVTGGPMWTGPCILADGRVLWSVHDQTVQNADKFLIYFGSFDGGLYCLDNPGNFIWKFVTGGPCCSGPDCDGNTVYFGSSDGYLYSAGSKDGYLKWKFRTTGRIGASAPLVWKDKIFICDFIFDEVSHGGSAYVLNKKGEMEWSFRTDGAIISTPLIYRDTLFIGSWDGHLYAISLKRQEVLWKFRTLFDKINFDFLKAKKHMEFQEEKTKHIFGIWKPEISKPPGQITRNGYRNITKNENSIKYGETSDKSRFSYSMKPGYNQKLSYKERGKEPYK